MDHVTAGRHSAQRPTREYASLEGLQHVDLAQSRVHDIVAQPGTLTVYLDAALLESHPAFESPKRSSQYDFRSAQIVFHNASDVSWTQQQPAAEVGFYGEPDHGPIDSFQVGNAIFEFTGHFGAITVRSFDCRLSLLEDLDAGGSRHRA